MIHGPNSHDFHYPRDEIPKWFTYQTRVTIMNIVLLPYWNNDNLLGMAFCIVLDQIEQNKNKPFIVCAIGCKLTFRTSDEDHLYKYHNSRVLMENEVTSNHVLMCCVPESCL